MINIDQFKEVEMRVGLVTEAVNQEGSEKLIKLSVRVSVSGEQITVFTGVRTFGYTSEYFVGKKFVFVTNLEPKKMMGEESQGMILAVDGPDEKPVFLSTAEEVAIGSRVR